jgi:lysozyme
MLVALAIVIGALGIQILGVAKIRHYYHKLEYKIWPTKFPNKSKHVNFEIYGIDVSHHNAYIDWEMVKDKGRINQKPISFVFIKATEGKEYKDKRFKRNIKEARQQGLLCGAYHFYRPEINSLKQFKNFKESVVLKKGDLPPVLDVELRGSLSFSRYVEGILNMLKLMENHYGIKPILYTSPSLYMPLSRYPEIKKYPLWLAAYDTRTANRYHGIYNFLQYTERGKVSGIKGYVDLNGFSGNKLDLQKHIIK